MITVSTFLWDDPLRQRNYKFTPAHVVTLRNMVSRNLTVPFEFVCVTDKPFQADGIRCAPLDWSKHVSGTCFVRLMLRHPRIAGLLGRRIFNLDLDVVIVANIDDIVNRPEPNVFWLNPNHQPGNRRAFYQTSVQLLTAGTLPELWTDFDPKITPTWVNRRWGGAEQCWVSERLAHDQPYWDSSHGIYGAGRLGDRTDGVGTELPLNAKIVSFPGNREPSQPDVQERHKWIREHYR